MNTLEGNNPPENSPWDDEPGLEFDEGGGPVGESTAAAPASPTPPRRSTPSTPSMPHELVDGMSVAALCRRLAWLKQGIPMRASIEITAQLAEALHYLHGASGADAGVHGELSPESVLVSRQHGAQLVGFDPARLDGNGRRTVVQGKPGYLAPEQAMAQPFDHRADLFAVGIILTELITGRRVIDAEAGASVFGASERVRELCALREDVSEALVELICSLTAQKPHDRPKNAFVVAERLRAMADQLRFQDALQPFLDRIFSRTPAEAVQSYAVGPIGRKSIPGLGSLADDLLVPSAEPLQPAPPFERIERKESKPEIELAPPRSIRSSLPLASPSGSEVPVMVRSASKPPSAAAGRAERKISWQAVTGVGLAVMIGIGGWALRSTSAEAVAPDRARVSVAPPAPAEAKNTRILRLETEPAGALITINGVSSKRFTPADLPPLALSETATVTLTRDGFMPGKVVLGDGSANLTKVVLEPAKRIGITTEPTGARIFVDDVEVGLSPLDDVSVPAKRTFVVRVQRAGFKRIKRTFHGDKLTAGQELQLTIDDLPLDRMPLSKDERAQLRRLQPALRLASNRLEAAQRDLRKAEAEEARILAAPQSFASVAGAAQKRVDQTKAAVDAAEAARDEAHAALESLRADVLTRLSED